MPPRRTAKKEIKRPLKETGRAVRYIAGIALRKQPWLVIMNTATTVIGSVIPILTSYLAGRLTTELYLAVSSHNTNPTTVYALLIANAAVLLVWGGVTSLTSFFSNRLEEQVRIDINQEIVSKFARLDFARYEDKEALDRYDRAKSFSSNVTWVLSAITSILGSVVGGFAALTALFTVSPYIALALTLGLIPSFLLQMRIQRERREYWRRNTAKRRVAWMAESRLSDPATVRELRLFGLVGHLLAMSRKIKLAELKEEQSFKVRERNQELFRSTLSSGVETVSLLWVVWRIIAYSLPVGQFIFFQQVMQRYSGSVSSLLSRIQGIDSDLMGSVDFYDFMTEKESPPKELMLPADGIPEIVFEHVSFKYPGSETYAVKDVSLTVPAGEKIALVGENGAGKSTLIKLMLGMYIPLEGRVLIGGLDTKDLNLESWFHHIGVLFQDFEQYNFTTIEDNIRFGRIDRPDHGEAQIKEALELAQADFALKLPHGLKTYLNKYIDEDNGTSLSGGQWQRLALARNFYRQPTVLMLDEPTSAIDAKAEYEIFSHLMKSRAERTTVIVSHRFSTVRQADYIYVLEGGEVVERGSHPELLAMKGRYSDLFEKQAEGYR